MIARIHARGLPPEFDWSDLLQEAFARVLDGSRPQPEGVPIVAFLAGVMRSIKAEYWRRAQRQARQLPKLLADMEIADDPSKEPYDPTSNPERSLIAIQEFAADQSARCTGARSARCPARRSWPPPGSWA